MYSGLSQTNIVAFVTIVDVERAKQFYRDKLGLTLVSEEKPFAIVFSANGIMLRLVIGKEKPPFSGTVLGWRVPDATAAVTELQSAGVIFEHFNGCRRTHSESGALPVGLKWPGSKIRMEMF